MNRPRRIGLLTGGGDCPGLNGVIRAVTLTALREYGTEVIGIEDGFEGLVEGRMRLLDASAVASILPLGGTILGTSNRGDPWRYPKVRKGLAPETAAQADLHDRSRRALYNMERWGLEALVAIGGDGTMNIAHRLGEKGVAVVGVPKTIDNDVAATDVSFGFDTAVSVVSEALDRLATTASSHHRVMVVEVMGRDAGWIALMGGVSGGAHVILLPEIAFSWGAVLRHVQRRHRRGDRFSIVCVAEGARLPEGGEVVRARDARRVDARQLGGIGAVVAARIEEGTGLETRAVVLGHLQRGGSPSSADRILATRLGSQAAHAVCGGRHGCMVAVRGTAIVEVPLADAIARLRTVPVDHDVIAAARAVGTSFGDEGSARR